MTKDKKQEIKIFLINLAIFLFIFSLGYILGDGWQRIDASQFRKLLYSLAFFVLPVYLLFIIYYFCKLFLKKSVIMDSLIFGLVMGGCVTLFLALCIKSAGGMVAMALLGLPLYFAVFFTIGFIGSAIIRSFIKIIKLKEELRNGVEPSSHI